MKFSFAIALCSYLSVALAAAVEQPPANKPLICYPIVAHGPLAVYKNSLKGQRVPLTLNGTTLVLQGTGGSKKKQAQFTIVPCTSQFLKKVGQATDNGKLLVNGRLKTEAGLCLARNPKDTAVKAVTCSNKDDKSQEDQFWTLSLVEEDDGTRTAKDASIKMVKSGRFHHLFGGIVHESNFKPPSNWILTFSSAK